MDVTRHGDIDAARYGHLADDHDRWGLAPEADALRELYRETVIRELELQADDAAEPETAWSDPDADV